MSESDVKDLIKDNATNSSAITHMQKTLEEQAKDIKSINAAQTAMSFDVRSMCGKIDGLVKEKLEREKVDKSNDFKIRVMWKGMAVLYTTILGMIIAFFNKITIMLSSMF